MLRSLGLSLLLTALLSACAPAAQICELTETSFVGTVTEIAVEDSSLTVQYGEQALSLILTGNVSVSDSQGARVALSRVTEGGRVLVHGFITGNTVSVDSIQWLEPSR